MNINCQIFATSNYCCDRVNKWRCDMITEIAIAVGAICLLYYFCTRNFNYWRDKNVVGPKPTPFFGNILDSALRKKTIGIVYKDIYDQFPNEKLIGFYRMTLPTLLVRDLDVVKQILIKDFDIFSERGILFSKEGLGDNLFHCDTNTWRVLRSRFTPAFSSGKMKATFGLVSEHGDRLIEYLERISSEQSEQELHRSLQKYTMATTMSAVFGLDIDMYSDAGHFVEEAGHYTFKTTYAAETDMLFPNILQKTNLSLFNDVVNKFCYEVVRAVVKERRGKPYSKNDLMDIMMAMYEEGTVSTTKKTETNEENHLQFTEHVMAGQILIMFAAGFGNNALLLSYTMWQLAKHRDLQDRLIAEIDAVLSSYDGKLTYEALKEMTYLDQVLSEILRMNPTTGAIPRSATQSYKIPGTDVVLDKGTVVIISPYSIHRDEELYPDPDRFDPERFSPENSKNRHPCAYIPFGAGPRSCLGKQLGRLQLAVAVAKFFTRFRVEPSQKTPKIEDYDPMRNLITTIGGIYVNIVPRS